MKLLVIMWSVAAFIPVIPCPLGFFSCYNIANDNLGVFFKYKTELPKVGLLAPASHLRREKETSPLSPEISSHYFLPTVFVGSCYDVVSYF